MGQFLPTPEQLPKVELDVFGISPSIYKKTKGMGWDKIIFIIILFILLLLSDSCSALNT